MASIQEAGFFLGGATYPSGVYRLETLTDLVQGGAAGVINTPMKNLADRTGWLKQALTIADGPRRTRGFPRTHTVLNYTFENTAGTVQAMTPGSCTVAIDPTDGALRVSNTSVGQRIYTPILATSNMVMGADWRFVVVDVENDGTVQLENPIIRYRTVLANGTFAHTSDAGAGAYPIGGQVPVAVGERRTLVFDMYALSDGSTEDWKTGRIDRLRIDLTGSTGATFKIRRIALLGPDVGVDLQRRRLMGTLFLFVNPTTGADTNSGLTAAAPLATVAAALRLAPPHMRTEITLADASVNEISAAQFPALGDASTAGRIHLRNQEIVILGPFRPAIATNQPTLRFLATTGSAGVVMPRFVGNGNVIFSSIKVEVPLTPAGSPNTEYSVGIVSSELQTVITALHFEGALVLSDLPAYVSKGGQFSVTTQTCTITFQPGVTPGKLLRIHDNAPAILNMRGGSVPAGSTTKQLVTMLGVSAIQADNTPRGLLTNVNFA